jgi:hypothetical protein
MCHDVMVWEAMVMLMMGWRIEEIKIIMIGQGRLL